jgi:hypothetical protein
MMNYKQCKRGGRGLFQVLSQIRGTESESLRAKNRNLDLPDTQQEYNHSTAAGGRTPTRNSHNAPVMAAVNSASSTIKQYLICHVYHTMLSYSK